MDRSHFAPISSSAHPLVKFLHDRMIRDDVPVLDLEEKSGLGHKTVYRWFSGDGAIILQNVEAALGVLGYGLRAVLLIKMDSGSEFVVGKVYRTASGVDAEIDRMVKGRMIGGLLKPVLSLEWDLRGRRIPAAGRDPLDLVWRP